MTTRPGYIKDSLGNWIQIGPVVPVGSTVYYQASEPSSPATGDIWIDSDNEVPSIDNSQFLRWRETAVGGETSLSGPDDTGLTLQYTPGYEQVYLNGVLLVRGQDYTATTGTSITGLTALAASDVVEVFSVVARVVGDVYTQSQTNSLLDAKSPVSTTGLVLLNTTAFSSATTVSIDNIFTTSYANYKFVFDGFGSSNGNRLIGEWIDSSGSIVNSNYYSGITASDFASGATTFYGSIINTGINLGWVGADDAGRISIQCDFYGPNVSQRTSINGLFTGINSGSWWAGGWIMSRHLSATQMRGIRISNTSGTNMTGTIKIYGYK